MDEQNVRRVKYFFRSEPMQKCELLLSKENAFNCMVEVGHLAALQFVPNTALDENESKAFIYEVRRCAELLKLIDFVEQQIEELKLSIAYVPDVAETYPPDLEDLGSYENYLSDVVSELKQDLHTMAQLHSEREASDEMAKALKIAEIFLLYDDVNNSEKINFSENHNGREQNLEFILGSIGTDRYMSLERVLFRFVRYNYYIKGSQIKLPRYQALQPPLIERRTVFLLCYSGKRLGERLTKICHGFNVKFFDCPTSSSERTSQRIQAEQDVIAIDEVLRRMDEQRKFVLDRLAKDLYIWKYNTNKVMAVYVELNKMAVVQTARQAKYLSCFCWVPVARIKDVRAALQRGASKGTDRNQMVYIFPPMLTAVERQPDEFPPTHFNVNAFTSGFQTLIDAYGLANYRELNPAPYTIITFPFLFAVMFGDVGHGIIMALFALALILKNNAFERAELLRKNPSEISKILFGGRYIIFLMGIFSIYTGLIYNDFFSKSLNIFGSHWYVDKEAWDKKSYDLNPESAANYKGEPYIFGMDPVWKISGDSAIITFNSVKMKLAIILGVFHMIFGLVLNAINQLYFKSYVDLLLISIPQLIIFSSLFFYLVILIFYKWSHFGGHLGVPYNTACAPSILITFIDMILMKQSVIPEEHCMSTMFEGQLYVQKLLLLLAFLCVPVLLAGKPIYFHVQQWRIRKLQDKAHKKRLSDDAMVNVRKSLIYQVEWSEGLSSQQVRRSSLKELQTENFHEYDMMEVWIHSGIHTIDSVLGAVSHTASYLRLWALSLAHEQLSDVLWVMVLTLGFDKNYYYSIALFFSFAIWAVLTFAILVTMEALSAFLHTLRLHWVEFQSKFYTGAGEPFTPFKFKTAYRYISI